MRFRLISAGVYLALERTRWRAQAILLAIACWLAPSPALAQQSSAARVDGVVIDSVHSAALSGALVLLARRTTDTTISGSTTTDARGRFTFDGLPPGDYVVALESALLDSLELSLPPSEIVLAPGERKRIDLSVPSGATLKTLVCPNVVLPAGVGAMTGRAWSATDETPLRRVAIAVRWSETTVDRATLRAMNAEQGVDVETDSLGRFRICGVPTGTYLDLHASVDAYRDLVLQVVVPDDAGVARQNISLSPAEWNAGTMASRDSTGSTTRSARPDVATLRGIVYGAMTPLPHVQLQSRGNAAIVTTDSLGRYEFSALPIGTQVLDVRRVGYLPRQLTVHVRPGGTRAPDLHLTPIATLDSIRVVAQRPRYREFESRARVASFGHFLRADDIARRNPLLTSDLVRQMPGFRIVRLGTSDLDVKVISSRGDTSLAHSGQCDVNVVIDGVPHQKINWIDPFSVGAMEIYPGVATAPVQYRSPCGTILIWTKRY